MNRKKRVVASAALLIALFLALAAAPRLSAQQDSGNGKCLLLQVRKGAVISGEIFSAVIKALIAESGSEVSGIQFVKNGEAQDGSGAVEVYVLTFSKPPADMQSLCSMLEEEQEVITAEPLEDPARLKSAP
jgi:hypothetical protein